MSKRPELALRPISLLTAAVSAIIGVTQTAQAQQLEEIIVTAERRVPGCMRILRF
jgi:hypothetical protein